MRKDNTIITSLMKKVGDILSFEGNFTNFKLVADETSNAQLWVNYEEKSYVYYLEWDDQWNTVKVETIGIDIDTAEVVVKPMSLSNTGEMMRSRDREAMKE